MLKLSFDLPLQHLGWEECCSPPPEQVKQTDLLLCICIFLTPPLITPVCPLLALLFKNVDIYQGRIMMMMNYF